MIISESSIDRFFLRFDYTKKVQIVILLCVISTLCLFVLIIKNFNPLLQNIDRELEGIPPQRLLNQLILIKTQEVSLNPSQETQLWNELKSYQKENRHDQKLSPRQQQELEELLEITNQQWFSIIKTAEGITSQHSLQKLMNRTFKHSFRLSPVNTSSMDQNTHKSHVNEALIQNILKMRSIYAQAFQMQLQFDWLTGIMAKVSFYLLPQIQEQLILNEQSENKGKLRDSLDLFNFFWSQIKDKQPHLKALPNQWTGFISHKGMPNDDSKNLRKHLFAAAQLNALLIEETAKQLSQQRAVLHNRKWISFTSIIFGLCIVLILYQTRIMQRPLYALKQTAEKLSHGDLSVRIAITTHDEVADVSKSFNSMVDIFETVMIDADRIANTLATATSKIFSTARQLESNLVTQEELINQIDKNAKGISRTVYDFALSIEEANSAANVTERLATLGRTSLSEMETIMQQMANASTNIVATLSLLQQKMGGIHRVILTMVRIADQINLLSLNTAIRASKKGGKNQGFSIIADKIRELADQTARVTLDIEQVVVEIFTKVQDTATEVANFCKQIQNQMQEATEVREHLRSLIHHTQTQISSFETVNLGMQEQTSRAARIQEAISQLMQGAQRITDSITHLYLEIEYLYHSTNSLQEMTQRFTAKSDKMLIQGQDPSVIEI